MNSRIGIGADLVGCSGRIRGPGHRPPFLLLLPLASCLALAALGVHMPRAVAAEPAAPTGTAAADSASPAVEEWLNQNVRLRETAQARSLPAPDANPSGEIRAGAEVKAIGLVAGKHWVQIELPDHSRAYLPREAIEYEDGGGAPAPPADKNGAASPPGGIRGKVTRVPNAATLVVGDQRVRLSGIDPGPADVLGPFESWVRGQGDLACEPDAQTGRYRCFTSGGVDIAEAAILNGSGRVGDGAIPEYRDSETQARQAHRGLWQGP
jgi:endonuclease YncB( thermonuclease family)